MSTKKHPKRDSWDTLRAYERREAPEEHATAQPVVMPLAGLSVPDNCSALAHSSVLDRVVATMDALGIVGEQHIVKLIYLAATSRLLDKIVSLVVKGPSSGGKTFLVQQTLRLFPQSAYHVLTSASDKALVYSGTSFKHRVVVIYEAAGLGEAGEYFVRSLISEGHIRHEVTEKGPDNRHSTRVVEKEGPTGFILTTTESQLHPENETRMFSVTVTDTPEQTRQILLAQAKGKVNTLAVDLVEFHAFQEWLESAERRVVIPFAVELVAFVPLTEIRIRRDFPTVLALIEAHALLHQATRSRDDLGRIVATVEDYAAVRALVNSLLGDGLESMVKLEIREVVDAVADLIKSGKPYVRGTDVAKQLKLHKSAAHRRLQIAVERGYLVNQELHEGRPAQLVLGHPLPDDVDALPDPSKLTGCVVAPVLGVLDDEAEAAK